MFAVQHSLIIYYGVYDKNERSPSPLLQWSKYLVNQRNASGRIFWRCGFNRKRDGSVTTEDGVLIRENAEHTPPSSQIKAQVDKVVFTIQS